ncbi:MAG: hypothetical protein LBU64_09650 [Planctomycetota bacterium]|nr:hypothetical protein [Planctomycetota bacterium]
MTRILFFLAGLALLSSGGGVQPLAACPATHFSTPPSMTVSVSRTSKPFACTAVRRSCWLYPCFFASSCNRI